MSWARSLQVRSWIALIMLMLCAMSYASTDEPDLLIPPPHLQNWGVTASGEKVLYFTEAGWTEFSAIVRQERKEAIEAAVAEAVKPLLVENAGLKAENASLRKPRRGVLLWILGVGGAALVGGFALGVAASK